MGKRLPGEEFMPGRRTVLSKDKIEFLETWKEEKHDHLKEVFQHLDEEQELRNHTHSIDAHTHDIFFTALTLLPLEVTKQVLSECVFFTCYLSDYRPGHFFHESELSGHHLMILLFPHGESIPKYWSYIHHQIAHYVLGHFDPGRTSDSKEEEETEANKLACKWVSESPYLVPRDNFDHCSCPQGIIDFCKALATRV
jgi:hypothetical protein